MPRTKAASVTAYLARLPADLALDTIAEVVAAVPLDRYVAIAQAARRR